MTRQGQCQYTDEQKAQQRMDYSGGDGLGVEDLANGVVIQAARDFITPPRAAYLNICFGDEEAGIPGCPFREERGCFKNGNLQAIPVKDGYYFRCERRKLMLRRELMEFFGSDWFELLCNTDPDEFLVRIGARSRG